MIYLLVWALVASVLAAVCYLLWRDAESRHRRLDPEPRLYPFAAPEPMVTEIEPLPRATIEERIAEAFAPDPVTANVPINMPPRPPPTTIPSNGTPRQDSKRKPPKRKARS